jgi:hypothetical protein
MHDFLIRTSHKLRPLPPGRWAISQRWNDLLFVHWPIAASAMAAVLPEWLEADVFQGSAWLGAVPFWLDRIKIRGIAQIPGFGRFPDLSLRTYVRDRFTGAAGIYSFSIDAGSLLAVLAARMIYHLPYHWADMRMDQRGEREVTFFSRRRLARSEIIFNAQYRGLGPTSKLADPRPGSLEHFLSERSWLFSTNRAGEPVRIHLHHVPWPLEEAEAEIERNDLPASIGLRLPDCKPVLYYSRRLAVYLWPAELLRPALSAQPVTVAVSPSG